MQKRTSSNNKTVLVYIGGIGFMFEVNQSLKHNLISPDVLVFFDGVSESGETNEENAFQRAIPHTNLRQILFPYAGIDWAVCSDGIFRKCQKIICRIEYNNSNYTASFHIDKTLIDKNILGIISSQIYSYDEYSEIQPFQFF